MERKKDEKEKEGLVNSIFLMLGRVAERGLHYKLFTTVS
jgi:hypothetical protein